MVQLYLGDDYIYTLDDLRKFIKTMNEDGQDELLAYFRDGYLVEWLLEGNEESQKIGKDLKEFSNTTHGNKDILNYIGGLFHAPIKPVSYKLSDYVEYVGCKVNQTNKYSIDIKNSGSVSILPNTKEINCVMTFKILKPENDILTFGCSVSPDVETGFFPTKIDLKIDGHKNELRDVVFTINVSQLKQEGCHFYVKYGTDNILFININKIRANSKANQTNTSYVEVKGYGFINMINIKGGAFQMGATKEQGNDASEHEKPAHSVMVKSYSISDTVVTQKLWMIVMGNNPSQFKGDNRPVTNVTYRDCLNFLKKLSAMTGKQFRLPTEEEWEFSARGGNSSQYKYSGSDNLNEVAWYYENSSNVTHDVATKQSNKLGLYDMSGNVWEWCSSNYREYGGKRTNDDDMKLKITRGGCSTSKSNGCRTTRRYKCKINHSSSYLGFRLAI